MKESVRNVEPLYSPYKRKRYSIIIPAAGEGTRMKSYGPKSLIEIGSGVTLLQYQLYFIRKIFPCSEIILVAGFEADKVFTLVSNQNIVCIENELYGSTNVCRSIGMALRAATTDKIMIIYGDLFFNQFALDMPFRQDSAIVVDTVGTMDSEEIGCLIKNNSLCNMHFDLPCKWGQISFFTGYELQQLKKIAWKRDNAKMYGFEIINQILDKNGKFQAFTSKQAVVRDIDSSKDLRYIKELKCK